MNFSQKGTPMYFTDSPHLQSIEAAMKMIPRHPLIQDAEQKGSSMKLKFLSGDHRDRFLSLFKRLRTNPLRSEPEYCAAIYLLTADPGLWETVVDLNCIIPGSQRWRVYGTEGAACTQCASSGGGGGKTGLYFIDNNRDPKITDHARCITARQDSGVSKRRGEHSAVLVETGPCAVINPAKECVRQNGRRVKGPNEPMYTITVQDRHGIIHQGRIRRLMPIECWRLQGFTDEQFNKAQSVCKANTHLYRMAGNSVTVPVITAIAQKIKTAAEMIGLDTT